MSELAEDILQDAFIKVMDRPDQAPADEGVVPWFYRTLRNAAIDRFRRREAADRAVEAFARELESHTTLEPEIESEICACVGRLASTLKAEYAEALTAADVQGMPVKACALARGFEEARHGLLRDVRRARLPKLYLPSSRVNPLRSSHDTNADAFTADNRPVRA